MEDAFANFLDRNGNDIIPLVAIVLSMATAVVMTMIIGWVVVRNGRERERTRREIAAYIAEGSITPEDAERILAPSPWYSRQASKIACDWRSQRKGWREGPARADA